MMDTPLPLPIGAVAEMLADKPEIREVFKANPYQRRRRAKAAKRLPPVAVARHRAERRRAQRRARRITRRSRKHG